MAAATKARHLIGAGNPLLDVSARVNQKVLSDYSLQENSQLLAEPQHEPLFNSLISGQLGECSLLPGGATLNSMRVAKWLLGNHAKCSFFGRVGGDNAGQRLREMVAAAGVEPLLQVGGSDQPTGQCAALLTGSNRTLVTQLGAALKFSAEQLQCEHAATVATATHMYIGGYLFSASPDAVDWLVAAGRKNSARIIMNLHAPFLIDFFAERLSGINVLFGNEQEAHALASLLASKGHSQFASAVAKREADASQPFSGDYLAELAELTTKQLSPSGGRVVFTNGPRPFATASSGAGGRVLQPLDLPREQIRDTNGCGDAFVGGYLAAHLLDRSEPECERMACNAAATIAQQDGCTLPSAMPPPLADLLG